MNVLLTTDTVGGVWNYAVELAGGLQQRGVNVTLAAMGGLLSPAQRAEAAHLQVRESRFRLEWMQNAWPDVLAAGEWLLGLAAELRADVVHLNGYAHAALPWEVPVVVVAHSCVYSWWRAVHGRAAPEPEWTRYRQAVTAGLAAADLVVAPTRAMLDALAAEYGPVARAEVIWNGRSAAGPPQFRKHRLIASAGRLWDPAKNLEVLRTAAAQVPWPILVAGPTESPDGALVGHAPLEALGVLSQRELRVLLNRAAIYAAPALYEPFGLAILEAAQAGCALVLADLPTLRELWTGAAHFVPPRDPEAVAAALRALCADPYRRAELARNAADRSRAFSSAAMADAYLDAYRRIHDRRPSPTSICA